MHATQLTRLLVVVSLFTLGSLLRAAEVTFIAPADSAPAALSSEDVKNILLGNLTIWPGGGGAIRLAILDSGDAHASTIQTYTSRTPDQFEKHWKKLVFSGKGVMPQIFKTEAELAAYVAKTPGAFGYVSAGADTAGAKAIPVN